MDIRPLITAEEIDAKLAEIGKQITEDYAGKELLLVAVLRGAFMVMADRRRRTTPRGRNPGGTRRRNEPALHQ